MGSKLPLRLQALTRYLVPNSSVADIGTDHALLPIYLIREGLVAKVIGVEVAKGPWRNAKKQVELAGLTDLIDIRFGDGLQPVKAGEVQVVVLAGIGGKKMAEILDKAPLVLAGVESLVLQPQDPVSPLRSWLNKNGWVLSQENLVQDNNRLYPILLAKPGSAELMEEVLMEVGPRLVENKHPLLAKYLEIMIDREQKRLAGLSASRGLETKMQITAVEKRLAKLKELYKCL